MYIESESESGLVQYLNSLFSYRYEVPVLSGIRRPSWLFHCLMPIMLKTVLAIEVRYCRIVHLLS